VTRQDELIRDFRRLDPASGLLANALGAALMEIVELWKQRRRRVG